MLVQELDVGLGGRDAVVPAAETMTFIREEYVFDGHAIGAHGLDDFVTLDLQDARVIGALDHQHRSDDVGGMEERRDSAMAFRIGRRIAHLVIKGLTEALPPGRDAFQCAHPVGNTKDIDADLEGFRMEGEGGCRDVTAIGSADHTDLVVCDPVKRTQIVAGRNDVAQVLFAMTTVVHVEEGFAIP